jgi:hypothetical protein
VVSSRLSTTPLKHRGTEESETEDCQNRRHCQRLRKFKVLLLVVLIAKGNVTKFCFCDDAQLFLLRFLLSSAFQGVGFAFSITTIPRDGGDHDDPNNFSAVPIQNAQ